MRFEKYLRPTDLSEAAEYAKSDGARLLAGGTDLIPRLKSGAFHAKTVIDLSNISLLSRFSDQTGEYFYGAMTRLREIQNNPLPGVYAVIAECAGHVSSMQVRNVATLGGNTCNASPSADTVPGLLLLDAAVHLFSAGGERVMDLDNFLLGPGKTALAPGEILTGFSFAPQSEKTGAAYRKYAIRGDSDIAIIGAGALVEVGDDHRIKKARIALSSVGPRALRIREAEGLLVGREPTPGLIDEAAAICESGCAPIDDVRASAQYRRKMVRLWSADALRAAIKHSGQEEI